jgi:hypothetical protein
MHSHRLEFPVKAVAKRASLVATIYLPGELLLFGYPDEQILPAEPLGWLRGIGSCLSDNDFDLLLRGFCRAKQNEVLFCQKRNDTCSSPPEGSACQVIPQEESKLQDRRDEA